MTTEAEGYRYITLQVIVRAAGKSGSSPPRRSEATIIKTQVFECKANGVFEVARVTDVFAKLESMESVLLPGNAKFWYREDDGVELMDQEEGREAIRSCGRDDKAPDDELWNPQHFFKVPKGERVMRVWLDMPVNLTEVGDAASSKVSAAKRESEESLEKKFENTPRKRNRPNDAITPPSSALKRKIVPETLISDDDSEAELDGASQAATPQPDVETGCLESPVDGKPLLIPVNRAEATSASPSIEQKPTPRSPAHSDDAYTSRSDEAEAEQAADRRDPSARKRQTTPPDREDQKEATTQAENPDVNEPFAVQPTGFPLFLSSWSAIPTLHFPADVEGCFAETDFRRQKPNEFEGPGQSMQDGGHDTIVLKPAMNATSTYGAPIIIITRQDKAQRMVDIDGTLQIFFKHVKEDGTDEIQDCRYRGRYRINGGLRRVSIEQLRAGLEEDPTAIRRFLSTHLKQDKGEPLGHSLSGWNFRLATPGSEEEFSAVANGKQATNEELTDAAVAEIGYNEDISITYLVLGAEGPTGYDLKGFKRWWGARRKRSKHNKQAGGKFGVLPTFMNP
ncbi:hypothetical protein P7C70_g2621, partial [Phenoliferia sp. Uapishka_3]